MQKSFSFGSVRNKLIQMSLQRRLKNRFRRTCTVLSCIHSCEYCIMTHFRQNVCPKGLVNPGLNRIFKGGSSLTHENRKTWGYVQLIPNGQTPDFPSHVGRKTLPPQIPDTPRATPEETHTAESSEQCNKVCVLHWSYIYCNFLLVTSTMLL